MSTEDRDDAALNSAIVLSNGCFPDGFTPAYDDFVSSYGAGFAPEVAAVPAGMALLSWACFATLAASSAANFS